MTDIVNPILALNELINITYPLPTCKELKTSLHTAQQDSAEQEKRLLEWWKSLGQDKTQNIEGSNSECVSEVWKRIVEAIDIKKKGGKQSKLTLLNERGISNAKVSTDLYSYPFLKMRSHVWTWYCLYANTLIITQRNLVAVILRLYTEHSKHTGSIKGQFDHDLLTDLELNTSADEIKIMAETVRQIHALSAEDFRDEHKQEKNCLQREIIDCVCPSRFSGEALITEVIGQIHDVARDAERFRQNFAKVACALDDKQYCSIYQLVKKTILGNKINIVSQSLEKMKDELFQLALPERYLKGEHFMTISYLDMYADSVLAFSSTEKKSLYQIVHFSLFEGISEADSIFFELDELYEEGRKISVEDSIEDCVINMWRLAAYTVAYTQLFRYTFHDFKDVSISRFSKADTSTNKFVITMFEGKFYLLINESTSVLCYSSTKIQYLLSHIYKLKQCL